MIFKRILILLIIAPLLGCYLFEEKKQKKGNKDISTAFDIVWRTPVTNLGGNYDSVLDNNILYFVENGISAINVDNGEILWQNSGNADVVSHLTVTDKYILAIDKLNEEKKDIGGIVVLDKFTGSKVGYIVPSILLFDFDEPVQFLEWWLKEHKGYLYMPIDSSKTDIFSGVYRINLSTITLKDNEKSYVEPELIIGITEKQRISTKPIFENDRAYFYIGGFGPLYVEGGHHLFENCYTQDVVRMVATDLEGNIIWERGFDYLGSVFGGNSNFKIDIDTLYAADASGLAAINKNTGKLVFEKKIDYDQGSLGVDYLEYGNGKMLYCMDNFIKCSNAKNGEALWEFDTQYSNSTNPIFFGDLIYNLDAEALRAFNIKTGELIYENKSLGIAGYRSVGYIPKRDDVIFIMNVEEIIAVRLKE